MVCFALVACATRSSLAERPIEQAPLDVLRIPASRFDDPKLKSQVVDLRSGIGPDEAATIALYSNPALCAIRDRRGLGTVQLIQAGTLPNPVVSYARDYVTGGNTAGAVTAYNFSAGWEFSTLVSFCRSRPPLEKISARSIWMSPGRNGKSRSMRALRFIASSRWMRRLCARAKPPTDCREHRRDARSGERAREDGARIGGRRIEGAALYFGVAVGLVAISTGAAVGETAACAADDGEVAGATAGEEPGEG
jgi:hypothetical protein